MPKPRALSSLPTILDLEPVIQARGETGKDPIMCSTSSSSNSSRSSSDTEQTVTASTRAREDGSVTNDSASELSESLPSLPQEIGSSANSSASGEEFPGLRSNVIAPSLDTVSDHNSRASSLGSSYATTRRGENDSRGSGFQTGQDAQQLTGRPANVTTATASAGLGHSIGSTLCRRSSETSGVRGESSRGESSRAGREQNRRARGQERVLSYLSGVSQAAVLTNFEEDLGIPVPPPPHPPPFLDTIIPRVWWMRILFWAMCALIIFMSPIYIWMVRALLGRT